jgi:hypothetical protein
VAEPDRHELLTSRTLRLKQKPCYYLRNTVHNKLFSFDFFLSLSGEGWGACQYSQITLGCANMPDATKKPHPKSL